MKIKAFIRRNLPIVNTWPSWLLKLAIKHSYKRALGKKLDLDNLESFNEKLQWYILYYDNPEISEITDKRKFKNWVSEKLGSSEYTAHMYGFWCNVEELEKDWDNLPEEFVLKSNMSFNGNNIKFITSKSICDFQSLKKDLKAWLDPRNTCLNSYSCRFNQSTPCIIAETFLKQEGHVPNDYKFYCFDGVPYCVYVATDHFVNGQSAISFYNLKWEKINVQYGHYLSCDVKKPTQFDRMVQIAKKLSNDFPFVRVDFFEINDKIYLSELTFDSGWGHRKFNPESFDIELGKQFHLPIK